MPVKKSKNGFTFDDKSPVKITVMGYITDLLVCDHITTEPVCVKISKDEYLDRRTGEVKEYNHTKNRAECYDGIRKTMVKIREIINCNVTDVKRVRWITLTYKENMTDTKRLYKDYDKFWKRFKYYCAKNGYQKPEYISVVEPQGRGAWHIHALYIWPTKAPYIENEVLAGLWKMGFVNIKQPKYCDNFGAYLCAYLTDMSYDSVELLPDSEKEKAYVAAALTGNIDPVEVPIENEPPKRIIKGARLSMYPPGMNIYRHSRNIKKPDMQWTTYERAMNMVSSSKETYSQCFEVTNDAGNTINRIMKASYNSKRDTSQ